MDIKELEKIKDAISTAKENKTRAEINIENITEEWQDEYGIDTIELAEDKLKELSDELDSLNNKKEKLIEKLKANLPEEILDELE